jgi:hypothetical protein
MNEDNTFDPMLVTVKARPIIASKRTKDRCSLAMNSQMWLDKISNPDCMGGKKCGLFNCMGRQHGAVADGRQMGGWFGWLPLEELLITEDGKILNCLDW